MFTTIVMLCSVATANDCVLLTDIRGPLPSEEACIARANEIARDIGREYDFRKEPDFAGIEWSYKCDPLEGTGV